MSTKMTNPKTLVRKWYIIDAAHKPLGKVAAQAAAILNGKHKTDYTPHVDCGDHVIILNAAKVELTGRKADQKFYRTHSPYVGSLKETSYGHLLEKRPEFLVKIAVKGMLPKNAIGRHSLSRLRVYKDDKHTHAAQKPEFFTLG